MEEAGHVQGILNVHHATLVAADEINMCSDYNMVFHARACVQ